MPVLRAVKIEGTNYRKIECKCDQCGKIFLRRYFKGDLTSTKLTFCSNTCRFESSRKGGVSYKKVRETSLKKYGTEHFLKSDDVKQKREVTCERRYGSKNVFQAKSIKEKSKRTLMKNHGVTNPSQSPELREKMRSSYVERYGVDNPFKDKEVRSRIDYQKRHETMKRNGSYCKSKVEDKFYEFLCEIFGPLHVKRHVKAFRWTIDFYVKPIDAYIQLDGVYWHGLDRPIDVIKEFRNPRDVMIYGTWMRDQEQNSWFEENDKRLLRVTDIEFLSAATKVKERLENLSSNT